MSVEIKFEPDNLSGIIAEGSYLWAAAKRMGVRLPAECEGRGECDTCAVMVLEGATLLSSLTEAERTRLSPERLAGGERLACQARVEHAGTVVLRPVPATERAQTIEESRRDFRREFKELPLQQKLLTLAELEGLTMFQTLSALADLPFALAEKVMDVMAGRGRQLDSRDRERERPPQQSKDESPTGGVTGEGPQV